jgi:hypothetical protein
MPSLTLTLLSRQAAGDEDDIDTDVRLLRRSKLPVDSAALGTTRTRQAPAKRAKRLLSRSSSSSSSSSDENERKVRMAGVVYNFSDFKSSEKTASQEASRCVVEGVVRALF